MDNRSFPEVADGRPFPPMAHELIAAGLNSDDACFAARMLRQNGYYLVNPDKLGWPDIHRFQDELRQGQGVREDGGGFWLRCIMALFGKKTDPVVSYQKAARRLLEEAGQ